MDTQRGLSRFPGDQEEQVPTVPDLSRLPKATLLKIAIDLNQEAVAELYEEGITRDQLIRFIESTVKEGLYNSGFIGRGLFLSLNVDDVVLDTDPMASLRGPSSPDSYSS